MTFTPEQLLAEIEKREAVQNSFAEFCKHVLAPKDQQPARHHLVMIDYLERLERGEISRLMIFCPPGMAKSTYAAVLFPAWWMIRNPNTKVVGVSYGADLANRNSSDIKQIITDFPEAVEYQIQKGKDRTENWATSNRCEYKAIGTGGGLTGFRAHLTIMDDLVADQPAADSETERERLAQYYGTVLKLRMTRGGRVPLNTGRMVLIMTRWHPDDIAGHILRAEGDKWTVLRLPALAEEGEEDPLGRQPGEPLWPEEKSQEDLENLRDTMSPQAWAGLFQQRPTAKGGNLFRIPQDIRIPYQNYEGRTVRAWDIAASTGKRSDWTVGTKLLRTSDDRYVILDVVRFRGLPEEVERRIVETAQQDGPRVRIGIPQDAGAGGKIAAAYLVGKLSGYHVETSVESGDKRHRAAPVVSQVNVGNLRILDGEYVDDWIAELAQFPSGRHDDQVDSLSRAFAMLQTNQRPARIINRSLLGR